MRKKYMILASLIVLTALGLTTVTPALSQPTLPNFQTYIGHDLTEPYWNTTVDWGPAINNFFTSNGGTGIPSLSINTYNVYINQRGYQMAYMGFINWSISSLNLNGTIPTQTILQHFTTPKGKEVFILTDFLTLLAYNDTGSRPDIPDPNDSLWSSVSFGFAASAFSDPGIASAMENFSVEVYPLVRSQDGNVYTWGMRYNNLVAVWQSLGSNDTQGIEAISIYSGLTFNYTLTFHPENNTVTISTSYEIGRPTNIWVITWLNVPPWGWAPSIEQYNETTTTTASEWVQQQGLSLSIVTFHKPVIVGYNHRFQLNNGTALVENLYGLIQNLNFSLQAGTDNERVLDTSFETKPTYDLYDAVSETYNATGLEAKTVIYPVSYLANNSVLQQHSPMFWPLHLLAYSMYPRITTGHTMSQLRSMDILSIETANLVFITAYPTWNGYTIIHDPVFIAYTDGGTTAQGGTPIDMTTMVIIAGAIVGVIVVAGIVVYIKKH
ncbi:MAG: hypothetical protein ACTSQY_04090 [Candidatus Odinarchaeia archaeon]